MIIKMMKKDEEYVDLTSDDESTIQTAAKGPER